MIRRSALIVLAILILVIALVAYFARNTLVEQLTEELMSNTLGARVDIDGLALDPFALQASFRRMQVADPAEAFRNRLELGPSTFDVDGLQLFAQRLIVDNLRVSQMAVGTPRTESGLLPKPESVAEETPDQGVDWAQLKAHLPKLDLSALTGKLDLDAALAQGELGSMKALDEAQQEAKAKLQAWEERLAGLDYSERAAALKQDYERLTARPIETLEDLKQVRSELKELLQRARTLRDEARATLAEARADLRQTKTLGGDLKDRVDEDVQQVRKLAKISDLDVGQVAEVVFGEAMVETLRYAMGYLAIARSLVGGEEEAPPPERREGRWVQYRVTGEALPRLLIRDTRVDGQTGQWRYAIRVEDIASDQKVVGRPTLLSANFDHPDGHWALTGDLDYTHDPGRTRVEIQGRGLNLSPVPLQEGDALMPVHFTPSAAQVDARMAVSAGRLQGDLGFIAKRVQFGFIEDDVKRSEQPRLYHTVRRLFADLDQVRIDARLQGARGDLDLDAESNIDRLFSQRLKGLVDERLQEVEQGIRQRLASRLSERKAELEAGLAPQRDALADRFTGMEAQVEQRLAVLEERQQALEDEYQARVTEAKRAAEDKVKDRLKEKLNQYLKR